MKACLNFSGKVPDCIEELNRSTTYGSITGKTEEISLEGKRSSGEKVLLEDVTIEETSSYEKGQNEDRDGGGVFG